MGLIGAPGLCDAGIAITASVLFLEISKDAIFVALMSICVKIISLVDLDIASGMPMNNQSEKLHAES
jgi:hypothetical protein